MAAANTIVQYVVVRGDLTSLLKWPAGAVIAQACHACTAVIHENYKDDVTQEYLNDLDRMHKIILEAKDADSLSALAESLNKNNVSHRLWVEQPENIPTCLAVKPYRKNDISSYFKGLKLLK